MHHGIYILTSSRGKHFHMLSLATESSPSITSYGLSLATERSHSKTKWNISSEDSSTAVSDLLYTYTYPSSPRNAITSSGLNTLLLPMRNNGYPLSEMRAGEIPSKDIHIQSVVHPSSSKQQPMLLCWLFGSTASIQRHIKSIHLREKYIHSQLWEGYTAIYLPSEFTAMRWEG